MKTLVSKQIPGNERPWFVVDAADQTLGRLATVIAKKLSGRDRVDFTPHIDNGAYIVVINAEKIAVTGTKEEVKLYRTHSGYMGGLKETTLADMRKLNPAHIISHAVSGMLPKNKLQADRMKRLKVYTGAEHNHAAQAPKKVEVK